MSDVDQAPKAPIAPEQDDDELWRLYDDYHIPVLRRAAAAGITLPGTPGTAEVGANQDEQEIQRPVPKPTVSSAAPVLRTPQREDTSAPPVGSVQPQDGDQMLHVAMGGQPAAPQVQGPPILATAMGAPAPPPSTAPPSVGEATLQNALKQNVLQPSPTTGRTPLTPPPTNPDLPSLARRQAELSQPLDPSDPKYKMGWGQRLVGTLANFAGGWAGASRSGKDEEGHRGWAPIYVGPGATNARYARDEAMREQGLEGVKTQIGTQKEIQAESEKRYADVLKQAYETQIGEAREKTSEAQGQAAEARMKAAEAAESRAATLQQHQDELLPKTWQQLRMLAYRETDPAKKAELLQQADDIYNREIGLHNAEHPQHNRELSARDRIRVTAKARELGKTVDDLTDEEINAALGVRGAGPPHAKDRQSFEDHWGRRFGQVERKYDAQRAAVNRQYGADKNPAAYNDNKAAMNQQFAQIESGREKDKADLQTEKDREAQQYGVYNQRPTASPAQRTGGPVRNYLHVTKPNAQGVVLGSDDGRNWFDVRTGRPYRQRTAVGQ